MNIYKKINIIALLFCVLIGGCGQSNRNPTASPTEAKRTATAIPPTSTPPVTPTMTQKPTRATFTTTPPTLTSHPTSTFLPALSSAEAEAKIHAMLKNNGGCQLPCFLGITPGQNIDTIGFVFSPLREIVVFGYDDTGGSMSVSFLQGDVELGAGFSARVSEKEPGIIQSLDGGVGATRKIVYDNGYETRTVYDNPNYAVYFQYYTLPYLLTTYGQPTQVYTTVEYGNADMGLGIDYYYIYLDYSDRGWVAVLDMPLTFTNDMYIGCPYQAQAELWLWSPGDIEMEKEYGFSRGVAINMFTVEEATSITLEGFYQQFKNPNNTTCLETPRDIFK